MGTTPPDLTPAELETLVTRLRALRPPWGTGLAPGQGLRVPTLVVTGGWSEPYEETARSLVGLGARHLVLGGRGHRVQDHPDATTHLCRFLGAHQPRPA